MNIDSVWSIANIIGLGALILFSQAAASGAPEHPVPRVTLSLSGQWEFLPEHADEDIPNGDSYSWGSLLVPALWWNAKDIDPKYSSDDSGQHKSREKLHEVPYCWYKKKFHISESMKGLNCLLRIVDVRWSAEVWLNGIRLGKHVGAYRPVEFDATEAIRPGEENVIVIKNGGGHTIPKYEDGTPSIPFGHKGWAQGASGIMGDIELKFFRDLTVSRIKINSAIHSSSCQAIIWVTNHSGETKDFAINARAQEKKTGAAASDVVKLSGSVGPGETTTLSGTLSIRDMKLWAPETPFLYSMDVSIQSEGRDCDGIQETFGMREFVTRDGGFYLNGKRIYLRGATDLAIVGFPSSGRRAEVMTDPEWMKKYLIDTARDMNVTCFRTHMGPWYKPYYEMADEYGQMIIGEFPNWPPEGGPEYYQRPGYVDVLHKEMELIAASIWNHPSIIIWAGCNEPYIWDYNEDEKKYLEPFFKQLDPTRPMMRAGAVSEAIADQHAYQGFWIGTIGDFRRASVYLKDTYGGKLPVCDTEYLETAPKAFSNPEWGRAQKWMGYNVTLERAEFTHALFAMEQTEVKRRLQFDGILPFWYGMFVSKGQTLGENMWLTYYALRNALAPVAVSLGIFDRHFATGSDLKLEVWTMNDLDQAKKGVITAYVLEEDPPYVFGGPPASPLAQVRLEVDIEPHSAKPHDVTLAIPSQEGSYWLYATLEVEGRETVISKRPAHVLDRKLSLETAKGISVGIIEKATMIRDWAVSAGVNVKPVEGFDYQVLIIGRDSLGSEDAQSMLEDIEKWVESGGRLVILDHTEYPQELFGLKVEKAHSDVSYLFKERGNEDDPVWRNIADAHLENWNGSGAEGLTHKVIKPEQGQTLCAGHAGDTGIPNTGPLDSAALVRVKVGKGEVMACQVRIADRLAEGSDMFDTVAERLMVNLLTKEKGL